MYFDYLASTPLDPRVESFMRDYWRTVYANPHSADHGYGYDAARAVEHAIRKLDRFSEDFAADGQWILTSGATEANNLALKGLAEHALDNKTDRRRILVSAIEHPSVLETARYLAKHGFIIEELPVTNDGVLDIDVFEKKLSAGVLCVSVMWANNETGVIQPIGKIAALCRKFNVIFHSDAAQAAGKIPLVTENGFLPDFISLSGHKFYGPKGIGALYAAKDMVQLLAPQMHGGGQQNGWRSGTVPAPLVAGLGAAAEYILADMAEESDRLRKIRDHFESTMQRTFPDVWINGCLAPRLPHVSHFQIPGVDMANMLAALPDIAVARSAACSTRKENVSHVMAAMRMEFFAHECLRVSFGRMTSAEDAEILAVKIIEAAEGIRGVSYAGFSAQKKRTVG